MLIGQHTAETMPAPSADEIRYNSVPIALMPFETRVKALQIQAIKLDVVVAPIQRTRLSAVSNVDATQAEALYDAAAASWTLLCPSSIVRRRRPTKTA